VSRACLHFEHEHYESIVEERLGGNQAFLWILDHHPRFFTIRCGVSQQM